MKQRKAEITGVSTPVPPANEEVVEVLGETRAIVDEIAAELEVTVARVSIKHSAAGATEIEWLSATANFVNVCENRLGNRNSNVKCFGFLAGQIREVLGVIREVAEPDLVSRCHHVLNRIDARCSCVAKG